MTRKPGNDESRQFRTRGSARPAESAGGAEIFSTRWSLVELAGADASTLRYRALEELLQIYLPAMRNHLVTRKRVRRDQVDDLLQEFVLSKILERGLVTRADREKGKFRTFLLTALDRFLIDRFRRETAHKPPGGEIWEIRDDDFDPTQRTPSDVFDVTWARTVLSEALRRMRLALQQEQGARVWQVFCCRILMPLVRGDRVLPYDQVVERCEFESAKQAANALITAKRQFLRHLHSVVAEYVESPAEIESEIRELRDVVLAPGALDTQVLPDGVALELEQGSDETAVNVCSKTDLAELLNLEARGLWTRDDLGPLFEELRASPIREVVPPSAPAEWAERPLRELFEDPQPPLAVLQATKRVGRFWARGDQSEMPGEIGVALYFLSIATALLRLEQRITKSSDAKLRAGTRLLLERSFLDAGAAQTFREFLTRLDESS